jgi:hypothetical protein
MKYSMMVKLAVWGLVLALSSCNLPASSPVSGGSYAWIDAPLNGFQLPLSAYDVVYHGSDASGVSRVELRINDELVSSSENPAPGEHLATLHFTWIPPAPGTYTLQARAQNPGGAWSDEAIVTVNVVEPTATPSPTPAATGTATATAKPTATPTITISPTSLPASFTEPNITPLVYSHMADCPGHSIMATIGASDPDGVKVLVLFYRLRDKNSGQASDWQSIAMNLFVQDQYTRTFEPSSSGELHNWAQLRFNEYGLGWEAWLDLQFVIQDNRGEMTRSRVYSDVTLMACNH